MLKKAPLSLKDHLRDQGSLLFQRRKGFLMNSSVRMEEALPMPLTQTHLFPLKEDHLLPQDPIHLTPDRYLPLSLPHKGFMQTQLVPGSRLLLLLSPHQQYHLGNVQCLISMV